jgi:hypothetical protein
MPCRLFLSVAGLIFIPMFIHTLLGYVQVLLALAHTLHQAVADLKVFRVDFILFASAVWSACLLDRSDDVYVRSSVPPRLSLRCLHTPCSAAELSTSSSASQRARSSHIVSAASARVSANAAPGALRALHCSQCQRPKSDSGITAIGEELFILPALSSIHVE